MYVKRSPNGSWYPKHYSNADDKFITCDSIRIQFVINSRADHAAYEWIQSILCQFISLLSGRSGDVTLLGIIPACRKSVKETVWGATRMKPEEPAPKTAEEVCI